MCFLVVTYMLEYLSHNQQELLHVSTIITYRNMLVTSFENKAN